MDAREKTGRACPVCLGEEKDVLERLAFAPFEDSMLPAAFDLAACRVCGHAFYDAPFTQATLDRYYAQNRRYAASATPGAGGDSEWDIRRQAEIIERLRPWAGKELTARPVYDLGCGRGGLVRQLLAAGFSGACGVEIMPETAEAVRRAGLPVLAGSVMDIPVKEADPPGLLIYSHVFEHLAEPGEALAEAGRRLAPGGLVYLEVPDASRYDSSIPWRELYQEHVSHYDPASLERLLQTAGFTVKALRRGLFPLPGGRAEGVVWAVARFAPAEPAQPSPHPAFEAAEALRGYLDRCRAHRVMDDLDELAAGGEPLTVWGLSQMTLFLLESSGLARADIRAFIDADPAKQGRVLKGLTVTGPESLRGAAGNVLLSAWGYEEPMLARLFDLKFKGRAIALKHPLVSLS